MAWGWSTVTDAEAGTPIPGFVIANLWLIGLETYLRYKISVTLFRWLNKDAEAFRPSFISAITPLTLGPTIPSPHVLVWPLPAFVLRIFSSILVWQ
jgi:hypothetical protein